jgi:hypothetical protein
MPWSSGVRSPIRGATDFTLLQNADASTEIWGARASFFHEIFLKK